MRHLRETGNPHVRTDQRRVLVRQQPASHETGDYRHTQSTGQFRHLVFQAKPANLDTGHQNGGTGGMQTLQDFVDAGIKRILIAGQSHLSLDCGTGLRHHVARNFDVNRLRATHAVGQRARDVGGSPLRIVQAHLVAGDFLEDLELRVQRLGLMVQQQSGACLTLARSARQHHQRRLLGEGCCNCVDHVQGTGTIGDRRHAQCAVDARRCVRRKPNRRLVREGVQRQNPGLFNDPEIGQGEVTGYAKYLARAVRLERVQQ